ncbi:uncharacterized protein [Clytia hemisphaerica]|uniref:Histone deacetylase domain-containing protein n=1 Tax=Clytia hemisphaerica TaxID=252671 RepID=A0A7M5WZL0_9CNID
MSVEDLSKALDGISISNDNVKKPTGEDDEKHTKELLVVSQPDEKPSSKTGLIYDEKMTLYSCEFQHPECPERISRIYQKLIDEGLTERCTVLKSRPARNEEIITKHTEDHFDFIMSLVDKNKEELDRLACDLNSIYLHKDLTESALLSAGCTLELVDQILKGNLQNGAAIVRPPGHHATREQSMGFCHLNNVALAAVMAIEKYQLTRVLILDWDVHYGNATHKMFDDDPRVLYFSLHRYDHNSFWPNLEETNYDSVGIGPGTGYNMHVAWNKGKIKSTAYLYAFNNLLIPVLEDYEPELILISAGFDAGVGDPLGGCKVTPYGYAEMTKRLMKFANGKVALALEGGYNLSTISRAMASCVLTLLGDSVEPDFTNKPGPPSDSALRSICDRYKGVFEKPTFPYDFPPSCYIYGINKISNKA